MPSTPSSGPAGLQTLSTEDSRLAPFHDSLFAQSSLSYSRSQSTAEQVARVDTAIAQLLRTLVPHFLSRAATAVLEYLVRQYECAAQCCTTHSCLAAHERVSMLQLYASGGNAVRTRFRVLCKYACLPVQMQARTSLACRGCLADGTMPASRVLLMKAAGIYRPSPALARLRMDAFKHRGLIF